MKFDYKWKGLEVILSDSRTPGEGEHKIFEHIRYTSRLKDYDKSTSHCIYGADSDLIILSLATQIPYITILREEFVPPPNCSVAAKR